MHCLNRSSSMLFLKSLDAFWFRARIMKSKLAWEIPLLTKRPRLEWKVPSLAAAADTSDVSSIDVTTPAAAVAKTMKCIGMSTVGTHVSMWEA